MVENTDILSVKQRFGIIGNSEALNRALGVALRVAPTDLSVLVTGESGVGKEFFPQIIHAYSARKHAKYIAVNCGAIPEGTIDSELFGHEKGSFTGATESRKGYFEEADGGTIFLDEVAELPLTTQARLLRVLESGEFLKVGSSVVQKTNIRVVAATNVDMDRAVREGKFREDLFYRLSTVQIQVPPLRDRDNDIALLARKFAGDFAEKYRVPAVTFDEGAREAMLHFRWPGNVRQLKNVVEQVALFEGGAVVDAETLRRYLPEVTGTYAPVRTGDFSGLHTYEREREMLFSMIFRLQSEIAQLRDELRGDRVKGGVRQQVPQAQVRGENEMALMKYHEPLPATFRHNADSDVEDDKVESVSPIDVTHSVVPNAGEGRTLEETERETIRMSLERNHGRRKATAAELNISERTLYRKIKEYGLE